MQDFNKSCQLQRILLRSGPQQNAYMCNLQFSWTGNAHEFRTKAIIAAGTVQKAETWILMKATVNYTALVGVKFKWLCCSDIKNIHHYCQS